MIYWPAKAPGETEDFTFDFTAALQPGENIASKVITAAGVTKGAENIAGPLVSVVVADGVLGTPGIVTCAITTTSTPARTYFETAILPIGEEPVTLAMAKDQCSLDQGSTTDDNLLSGFISAAREYVEAYCGARVMPAAVEMTFAGFADLERLTQAPVQSITAVQYLDANGALQTLDPTVYEAVNVSADILRPRIRLAYNQQWPSVRVADDAVRVSAVVGYTVVPKPMLQAMLLLIGQWYDFRLGVQVDARGTPAEIPNTVSALLSNFRR